MKQYLPTIIVAAAFLGIGISACAALSPVTIRVEQVSKSETEKEKKTQQRSLKIHITNGVAQDLNLTVKYAFFGRDVKEKDVSTVDSGERAATVKARSTEIVETGTAKVTSTEAQKGKDKKKKEKASGTKFYGYGVQVYDGDKLVAEAYEPLSVKESMGKTPPKAEVKK